MRNTMYKQVAAYVVNNNASRTRTCKEFGITKRTLKDHMKNAKLYMTKTYNMAVNVFNEKPSERGDLPTYLQVAQYVIDSKPTREQVMKRFELTHKSLYDALRYLKSKNENMYNRVKAILK